MISQRLAVGTPLTFDLIVTRRGAFKRRIPLVGNVFPQAVSNVGYTGHINHHNYPFSLARDPSDSPIRRLWAKIRS